MNVITLIEEDIVKGWDWLVAEATGIYNDLKSIVETALKAFESMVVNDLWGALSAFAGKIEGGIPSLADAETAFLNVVQLLGKSLLSAAQTLGSTLLQSLLGVLSHKAGTAAA